MFSRRKFLQIAAASAQTFGRHPGPEGTSGMADLYQAYRSGTPRTADPGGARRLGYGFLAIPQ